MIYSITRENTVVTIRIDSKLGTCKPIYPMCFDTGDQETAELLKRHFEAELKKYAHQIAVKPLCYLTGKETSELKRSLTNWSTRTNDWK